MNNSDHARRIEIPRRLIGKAKNDTDLIAVQLSI